MIKHYRIDCVKFCGSVDVDENNIIVDCMPIIVKFKGQKIENLKRWVLKTFGEYQLEELKENN